MQGNISKLGREGERTGAPPKVNRHYIKRWVEFSNLPLPSKMPETVFSGENFNQVDHFGSNSIKG